MTRRVAVTGAGSGIGQAVADASRARGDEVIGIDRRDTDVLAELSTTEGRRSAAAEVADRCDGALDALVACAGISDPEPLTVRVNYFGVTELATLLRSALAEAAAPRVAVVGSIAGTRATVPDVLTACLRGDEPTAIRAAEAAVADGSAMLLYPSSKAALAQWVRRTSVEPGWADAGIPINVVAPGVVRTPLTEAVFQDERLRQAAVSAVPMPLHGHAGPEVIASALDWLVSPANSHMTGQVIYVDGGAEATLRGPERF